MSNMNGSNPQHGSVADRQVQGPRRRHRRVGAVALAAMVVAGTAALTGGSTATATTSPKPFSVFAILPKTGALADYGYAFQNSLRVASATINRTGGILGRPIRITFVDDQGAPTSAVSLLQERLSSGNKPDLVWASVTSSAALALLPTLMSQKIMTIGIQAAAAVADPKAYPYFFSGSVDAGLFPQFVAAQLKSKGYTKVGVIAGNDATGQSVTKAYSDQLQAAGITVSAESYAPADLDMSAPLQRLQSSNPEAILVSGLGASPGYILKSRTKVGIKTPTFVDQSVSNDLGSLVSAADLEGVNLLTWKFNVVPDKPTAVYSKFLSDMQALGPIKGVFILNAWPHDMLMAMSVAYKQAKSTDPDKVKAALENLKWPKSTPTVTFAAYKWTSTSHFQTGNISDYTAASLKPWDNGRYLAR